MPARARLRIGCEFGELGRAARTACVFACSGSDDRARASGRLSAVPDILRRHEDGDDELERERSSCCEQPSAQPAHAQKPDACFGAHGVGMHRTQEAQTRLGEASDNVQDKSLFPASVIGVQEIE